MPSAVHEAVVVWLSAVLWTWGRGHAARVLGSNAKIAVGERRGRMPDLSVFLAGARRPPATGPIRTPPSIAIEIISPTPKDARRDRVEKGAEYATFGVRWYWLVDPQVRTFEILELGADGRWILSLAASEGHLASIPGCEGLTLDLNALWQEVDEVRAEGADAETDDPGAREP